MNDAGRGDIARHREVLGFIVSWIRIGTELRPHRLIPSLQYVHQIGQRIAPQLAVHLSPNILRNVPRTSTVARCIDFPCGAYTPVDFHPRVAPYGTGSYHSQHRCDVEKVSVVLSLSAEY